jgi:hypothetical protein
MKLQSFALRVSALGARACGLAAILAAAACGDDTGVFNLDLDAGGTTPDATVDAGSSGGDAGTDSAADAGSVTLADGGDGGVVDASAADGTTAFDAGDGGAADAGDAGADAGSETPDAGATDGSDAGNPNPDGGDAAAGSDGGDAAPSTGTTSANLIVNGDAEAAVGSTNGAPVATPGWTSTGEATALAYGSGGYPALTDPGPADRGMNLFIGGQDDATSSLTQTIDVSADVAAIDASAVTYTLSGWLGGFEDQEDYATLTVTFQDMSGDSLGTGTIGPVTAEDRSDLTGLLERDTTGPVPPSTRSVLVVLAMVREAGANNDGYADDLSLTLSGL